MLDESEACSAEEMRVLVMAHSHPRLTQGGAEISAYKLFQALKGLQGTKAWFFGCSTKAHTGRIGINLTQPFAEDDYLYQAVGAFDHFKFANRDPQFPPMLRDLLLELRPTIVHFHHYTNFGVEVFHTVKRTLPNAKIILTLHEYLAICNNYGQMVKTKGYQLCDNESPADCQACFPDLGQRDFFLRKLYIQTFFNEVDLFISPSLFLAERYIAWGVPRSKIITYENLPPEKADEAISNSHSLRQTEPSSELSKARGWRATIHHLLTPKVKQTNGSRDVFHLRIGFFGQMSPLKGIGVLLDAAKNLSENCVNNVMINIHGDYSNQPPEFQEFVVSRLASAGSNVRFHGPYRNRDVHRLMQEMDVVLVPSVWWENSPVVIQEAFSNRKPVICSNIGGMAEKVRPGVNGYWFEVGNGKDLASLLTWLALHPEKLATVTASVSPPPLLKQVVDAHIAAYRSL